MKLLRTGQFICKELGREPASRRRGPWQPSSTHMNDKAAAPAGDIASPCNNVCRMNPDTDCAKAAFARSTRSPPGRMGDAEKRTVLAQLPARRTR